MCDYFKKKPEIPICVLTMFEKLIPSTYSGSISDQNSENFKSWWDIAVAFYKFCRILHFAFSKIASIYLPLEVKVLVAQSFLFVTLWIVAC